MHADPETEEPQVDKQKNKLYLIISNMYLSSFFLFSRRFKDDQIDVLVATDVAARGLDIDGVKTVRGTSLVKLQ